MDLRAIIEQADIGKAIKKEVESQDFTSRISGISGKMGAALGNKINTSMLGVKLKDLDYRDLNQWVVAEILDQRHENQQQLEHDLAQKALKS